LVSDNGIRSADFDVWFDLEAGLGGNGVGVGGSSGEGSARDREHAGPGPSCGGRASLIGFASLIITWEFREMAIEATGRNHQLPVGLQPRDTVSARF